MFNLNFVILKRHFPVRYGVIWVIVRKNRFSRFFL